MNVSDSLPLPVSTKRRALEVILKHCSRVLNAIDTAVHLVFVSKITKGKIKGKVSVENSVRLSGLVRGLIRCSSYRTLKVVQFLSTSDRDEAVRRAILFMYSVWKLSEKIIEENKPLRGENDIPEIIRSVATIENIREVAEFAVEDTRQMRPRFYRHPIAYLMARMYMSKPFDEQALRYTQQNMLLLAGDLNTLLVDPNVDSRVQTLELIGKEQSLQGTLDVLHTAVS